LTEAEKAVAMQAVIEHREKMARDELCAHLTTFGTDEEIISEAQKRYGHHGPITLYNRYYKDGGSHHLSWSELGPEWHRAGVDPCRRPVLMQGSKSIRIRKHSLGWYKNDCANGWAMEVLERALRIFKITAMDYDECREKVMPIAYRLADRHYVTNWFTDNARTMVTNNQGEYGVYLVAGRLAWLSKSEAQNIKALRRIVAKCDTLEERRAAAIEHMKKRLAA